MVPERGGAGRSNSRSVRRSNRRIFLGKVGACTLGAVGTVGLLGEPPRSCVRADEQFVSLDDMDRAPAIAPDLAVDSPAAEPLSEQSADPFAVYMYRLTRQGFEPTSPINLVVVPTGTLGLGDVLAVFENDGWYRSPEEYVRYARGPDGSYVRQQATAAETVYGSIGRCHVRCWTFDGVISVQVHADEPPAPHHGIATYTEARHRVERLFADAGWFVARDALDFGTDAAPDHDGSVTVIER